MKNTIWFSCGVLQAEMTELHRLGKISGQLIFMDSMLHMDPPKLETALCRYLEQSGSLRGHIVIVYGDCCAGMLDLVKNYQVARIDCMNCAQLLLGKSRYQALMHSQSFILLPEWLVRWQEIIGVELGLDSETAKSLLGEHRKELVYLYTGLAPIPEALICDMSAYTGLPWRVEKGDLSNLLEQLIDAENRLLTRGNDA